MKAYKPTSAHVRYAARLRGVAAAGAAADPKDERVKLLLRQARALEAATRVDAERVQTVLIGQARTTINGMAAEARKLHAEGEDSGLLDAICLDGRDALNRLANMIRCNDPDPADPPATTALAGQKASA